MASRLSAMRLTAAVVAFLAVAVTTNDHDDFSGIELVLLHISDMHSRFEETDVKGNECRIEDAMQDLCYGGFARVAQFVHDERQKAENSNTPLLFLMAGDEFHGTAYFTIFHWKPVAEIISRLRPDVMTLGNHEFDDGVGPLVSFLKHINNIPTVVSNLNMTQEPDLKMCIETSHVFTFKDIKIGIVGYLTTDTPTSSNTGAVQFLNEVESLKKETKKLRKDGVHIIIGLGHSGIEKDKIIAKEVEDIDIIVGGHSHTFLYSGTPPSIENPSGPYPLYVENNKKINVPILHAYANTKYVGKVVVQFNSKGDLIKINGSPILLNHNIKQDQDMLKLVNRWKLKLNTDNAINERIGYTAVDLRSNYSCYRLECNIGNLIADSYVYYNVMKKKNHEGNWTDAPIAIIHAGALIASINKTNHTGYMTFQDLINAMPHNNLLYKVTISGKNLFHVFEQTVFDYVVGYGGANILQVSGVQVEYDLTKKPGPSRIVSLLLRCGDCTVPTFKPVDMDANYTILMSEFLANGGNNFELFKLSSEKESLGIYEYDVIQTYTLKMSPIITGIDGRMKFKFNNNEKSEESNLVQKHEITN